MYPFNISKIVIRRVKDVVIVNFEEDDFSIEEKYSYSIDNIIKIMSCYYYTSSYEILIESNIPYIERVCGGGNLPANFKHKKFLDDFRVKSSFRKIS